MRSLIVLSTLAAVVALAGCSAPAPALTPSASKTADPIIQTAPITDVKLDRELAWAQCQQLVSKRLKATMQHPVFWTHEAQRGTAQQMVATGDASFDSHPAWSFECDFAFSGSTITSQTLTMGVLG